MLVVGLMLWAKQLRGCYSWLVLEEGSSTYIWMSSESVSAWGYDGDMLLGIDQPN